MKPKVFLILSSSAIGGAEKRFAGLWLELKRQGDSRTVLVVPAPLRALLARSADLAGLEAFESDMVTTRDADHTPRGHLFRTLARLRLLNPSAVFHFTLLPPVFAGLIRPDRTIFTVPNSTLRQFNWKGLVPVLASVALCRRTDVLDETVCEELARRVPFRRNSLSVTPGSFVDLEFYRPAAEKGPTLVFTGLFSEEKQIDRLVAATPALDTALKDDGLKARFRFLGRETRQPGVAEACGAMKGVDVKAWFEPNPVSVLAGARAFFSVQRTNNYPSKALLEGMACGCLPIVTDVGTTRRIAHPDFAWFVPQNFTADDLIGPVREILTMPEPEFSRRVERMRAFLAERFSVGAMRSYYERLWAEVAA